MRTVQTMFRLARYAAARLSRPELSEFASEGLGIEARAARCGEHWRGHLACCRAFQRTAARAAGRGQTLAVLGSGRLLDVDGEALLARFERVDLYDADPGSRGASRRFARRATALGRRSSFVLTDLTGRVVVWRARLAACRNAYRGDAEAALAALRDLPSAGAPPPLAPFDTVLSLNLLSQLPVMLRAIASSALGKLRGSDEAAEAIERELDRLSALLIREHLELIARTARRTVLLVTDTDFFTYRPGESEWERDDPLCGETITAPPGFRLDGSESWLWHVAPHGIEHAAHGMIHRVAALSFRAEKPPFTSEYRPSTPPALRP